MGLVCGFGDGGGYRVDVFVVDDYCVYAVVLFVFGYLCDLVRVLYDEDYWSFQYVCEV